MFLKRSSSGATIETIAIESDAEVDTETEEGNDDTLNEESEEEEDAE